MIIELNLVKWYCSKMKITHKFIYAIVRIIIFSYVGFGIILFIFQYNYIYQADKTPLQDCPAFKNSELISFGTARGYLTVNSPDKLIVFYHGNAGRACDRDYLNNYFLGKGYSTYFVEYSGYAETDNDTNKEKLLKNVEDTIAFLKTKKFTNITVASESVGTGPASYHAFKTGVDKLILITAYDNFANVTFSHYPFYPIRIMLRSNFTPDIWLSGYKGPVSIILAENDEVVPNKTGKRLYTEIPSSLKNLYIIKNAGHNTIYNYDEFYNALSEALK